MVVNGRVPFCLLAVKFGYKVAKSDLPSVNVGALCGEEGHPKTPFAEPEAFC